MEPYILFKLNDTYRQAQSVVKFEKMSFAMKTPITMFHLKISNLLYIYIYI